MPSQFAEASEAVPIQYVRPSISSYRQLQVMQCVIQVHPWRGFREHFVEVGGINRLFVVEHLYPTHLSGLSLLPHSEEYAAGDDVRWDQVSGPEQCAE